MQRTIRLSPSERFRSSPPPRLVPPKISRKTSYMPPAYLAQIPQLETPFPSSSRASYLALKIFH